MPQKKCRGEFQDESWKERKDWGCERGVPKGIKKGLVGVEGVNSWVRTGPAPHITCGFKKKESQLTPMGLYKIYSKDKQCYKKKT